MNGEISSQTNDHQNHSDINSFNEDDRQQSHGSPIFSKHFYKMINQQSKFHQFNATYSANDSSSSVKQPANLSITTNFNRADFSPSSCVSSSSTNSSYDDKQSKFKMLKSPHDSKKSAKEEEAIDAISPAQFSSRFNGINYNNTTSQKQPISTLEAITALNAFNAAASMANQFPHPTHLFEHFKNESSQPNSLLQFMSPSALAAAAAYYNNSNNNKHSEPSSSSSASSSPSSPNSSSPSSLYQRSYLEALRFYKAAYNNNNNNNSSTNSSGASSKTTN